MTTPPVPDTRTYRAELEQPSACGGRWGLYVDGRLIARTDRALDHAAEVRATAADAARQARGVLAALADPDDGLTATAAMRNRIEGAAVALDAVVMGHAFSGQLPGGFYAVCCRFRYSLWTSSGVL